jgi:hypothetical protein
MNLVARNVFNPTRRAVDRLAISIRVVKRNGSEKPKKDLHGNEVPLGTIYL